MANGYKLDKGFLFDHCWEKQFRKLKARDFHKLFWEIYDYQVSNGEKSVPSHDENAVMSGIVSFVIPQINHRLWGQKNQYYQGLEANETTLPPRVGTTSVTTPLKIRQDKTREDKVSQGESRQGETRQGETRHPTASPPPAPLSPEEKEDLIVNGGVPPEYIEGRTLRAETVGRSMGKSAYELLRAWWEEDAAAWQERTASRPTPSTGALHSEEKSYDTDEFFEAAMRRSEAEFLALMAEQSGV